MRYSDPYLGFAVAYPQGWEVMVLPHQAQQTFPPTRPRGAVQFVSNLYAGGQQASGLYTVTVAVGESNWATTVTDTVKYYLTVVLPTVGPTIQCRYGVWLGGEPAIELTGFSSESAGRRLIVALHEGWEYWLSFKPDLDLSSPSDLAAQAAFDDLLRTFRFMPMMVAPTPTITPVPTPQIGVNAGFIHIARRSIC